MKRLILSLCCSLSVALQVQAQLVFTGFDLDPGAGDSSPWQFVNYNGKMLFVATTAANGAEPWISDGTVAGTQLLKDINPGAGSSGALTNAVVFNNKLYFAANDGSHGIELWVSDGTAAGTQLLIDIKAGAASSNPYRPSIYNGKIYFAAEDANGSELWSSDGTTAGTQMLKDIYPGAAYSGPGSLTIYNGLLYFFATNASGHELWVTDGTSANTQLIKDLNPGPGNGANPYPYTRVYNGKLYFAGDNGATGTEVFATDGTTAGTVLVANINSAGPSYPSDFYEYKGKLYFGADDGTNGRELWMTDGTNTTMVKDINPGPGDGSPTLFYTYKNNLYFGATRSSAPDYNFYKSDGTGAGTVLIAPAIAPNINPCADAVGYFLNTTNNTMYVRANYNTNGLEMWAIQDTSTTDIENLSNTTDVRIYPNPAHNNFTIKTTTVFKAGSVTLTDLTGRIVKAEKLHTNLETVSVEGIAPGIYMADIWLDNKRTIQKITIQ